MYYFYYFILNTFLFYAINCILYLILGAQNESRMMIMEQAKLEMEAMSQASNSVASLCQIKCVSPGAGAMMAGEELSIPEQACLDRCVTKFMETQSFVMQVMQRKGEEQMKMQAMAMGGAPGQQPGGQPPM